EESACLRAALFEKLLRPKDTNRRDCARAAASTDWFRARDGFHEHEPCIDANTNSEGPKRAHGEFHYQPTASRRRRAPVDARPRKTDAILFSRSKNDSQMIACGTQPGAL